MGEEKNPSNNRSKVSMKSGIPISNLNKKKISTHVLLVVVDFCLTLTDAVEPENTGFYAICCFYVGVSGGVKGCGIGVVNGVVVKVRYIF